MRRLGRKKILFLVVLIVIPLTVYFLSIIVKKPETKDPVLGAITQVTKNPIEEIAEDSILKEDGEYAIYVKNLKTKEKYSYNENQIFNSASLYKLWVMAVAYDGMSKGRLDPEQLIAGDARKLNVILEVASASPSGSPTPELSEEEKKKQDESNRITYSLENAIEQMITISDNYAALLVASRSGNFNIQTFLKNNYKNSSFGEPPKTTAKDISDFYEDLYLGQLVDKQSSLEMIEILKRQTLNDRIPKYLPIQTKIAHKTGELAGFKHDAGIVFNKKGDYIIVVLSKTNNPRNAAEQIALFSKKVFDYFN